MILLIGSLTFCSHFSSLYHILPGLKSASAEKIKMFHVEQQKNRNKAA